MNTTQSIHAGVALGLAQPSQPAIPAQVPRPVSPPAARRKTLVFGLLAVASCAAVMFVSKAAMIAGEVLMSLDAIYTSKNY